MADGTTHTDLRKIISRAFTPRAIEWQLALQALEAGRRA